MGLVFYNFDLECKKTGTKWNLAYNGGCPGLVRAMTFIFLHDISRAREKLEIYMMSHVNA